MSLCLWSWPWMPRGFIFELCVLKEVWSAMCLVTPVLSVVKKSIASANLLLFVFDWLKVCLLI